ncbi:MAG: Fe-S cluster assembly protein SufD [Candidatus Kapabacteria bacterium]|nr:Fe-S cluster assembly protein SufD [Candidatus Kapabacteria bacterium]MDW7996180.1 Fe-S cluster assembly protein SufD [Bacteroidota bacterium]
MSLQDLHSRLTEAFERRIQTGDHYRWAPNHPLRHRAFQAFQRMGFPTTRHEDWKYTSLAPVLRPSYNLEPPSPPTTTALAEHLTLQGKLPLPHLWVANGLLLTSRAAAGFQIQSLSLSQTSTHSAQFPIGQILEPESETFVALNTALTPDAILLTVEDAPSELFHIALVTTAEMQPQLAQPRLNIAVQPNSFGRVAISLHATGSHPSLTNAVAEVSLDVGSELELILWELPPTPAFAIVTVGVKLAAHARLRVWTVALGGALLRNNLYIRLGGPSADAQLFGATMVNKQQVVDHRTLVEHRAEGCTSNQLYKSVADEQGTVTFTGRIHVYPGAQKTNAYQAHRAVLLSEKATVNARPQLEIYADDVRCTHGATAGTLDEEALFYMRSRGLPESHARALLLHAFVSEALTTLPDELLRSSASQAIAERAHPHAEVVQWTP